MLCEETNLVFIWAYIFMYACVSPSIQCDLYNGSSCVKPARCGLHGVGMTQVFLVDIWFMPCVSFPRETFHDFFQPSPFLKPFWYPFALVSWEDLMNICEWVFSPWTVLWLSTFLISFPSDNLDVSFWVWWLCMVSLIPIRDLYSLHLNYQIFCVLN